MAYNFPAQAKVNPSFSEPDLIVTYAQPSGFMYTMENSKPRVKIGPDDLYVYINRLDIRTDATASQFGSNFLPSASLQAEFDSTQTYLLRNRSVYDDAMMRAAGRYNVSLANASELAQRQGIYQYMRTMYLYGINAANNEGLLNTQGATAVTMPADSYGNTTVQTYDNGDMLLFLASQIVNLKTRMYQSGGAISNRITILSPQREFLAFQYSNVVQTTSYQRPGGGTNTVAGTLGELAKEVGDVIEWYYDDTLIGKGAGGTDAIIITIPEVVVPEIGVQLNTAEFNELNPSTKAVNVMYNDVAAPVKIATPAPDGAITEIQEIRSTCGWNFRPEGLSIISMTY